MAVDARVFGRPASSAVAKDVMSAPTMHQTPAPAQPADVVENPSLPGYYNALDACYDILKHEMDSLRRLRVEEARSFFDGVIASFEEPDTTAQAPASSPTPPPAAVAAPMGSPAPGPIPGGAPPPTAGSLPSEDSVPSATTPPAA